MSDITCIDNIATAITTDGGSDEMNENIHNEKIKEEADKDTIIENAPNYVLQKLMERGLTYEDIMKKILLGYDICMRNNDVWLEQSTTEEEHPSSS